MSDERVTRPLSVCLLWLHPLLESEFQRLLCEDDCALESIRIEPDLMNRIEGLASRDEALYVVETDGRRIDSEALVAGVMRRSRPGHLIVVAEEFTEATAFPLLRLGAKGLLSYAEIPGQLKRALNEVAMGGFWVPRALLSRFVDSTLGSSVPIRLTGMSAKLTPREEQIFEDLLENLSNKDIAKKRHISGRTAKFHVSNVLAKYGVKRRADLLLLSFQKRQSTPAL